MLFDSHAHINNDTFTEEEREALIADIEASDLSYVMDIGFDLPSSEQAVKDAQRLTWCYAAVGVHPHDAKTMDEDVLRRIKELAGEEKVQAIGEIGLDFHYNKSEAEDQRYWFRRQIQLANELKMPIVIHSREADQETMDILKEEELSAMSVRAGSRKDRGRRAKRTAACCSTASAAAVSWQSSM